jgi:hypothetical protein
MHRRVRIRRGAKISVEERTKEYVVRQLIEKKKRNISRRELFVQFRDASHDFHEQLPPFQRAWETKGDDFSTNEAVMPSERCSTKSPLFGSCWINHLKKKERNWLLRREDKEDIEERYSGGHRRIF